MTNEKAPERHKYIPTQLHENSPCAWADHPDAIGDSQYYCGLPPSAAIHLSGDVAGDRFVPFTEPQTGPERIWYAKTKWGMVPLTNGPSAKHDNVEYVRADQACPASAAPVVDNGVERVLSVKELGEAALASLEKVNTATLAALGQDRDAEAVGNARRFLDRLLYEIAPLCDT